MDLNILSGTFGIVIVLFLFFLAILWFLLPFAVFGVKDRLERLIDQNEQIITLLKDSNIEPTINDVTLENEEIEPTISQPRQVYNTATGKMEYE
jgi:hypothetical protein